MSHFLARLVERARDTAPRVEPIIAPRFAPGPIADFTSEIKPAAPARRETDEKETVGAPRNPAGRSGEPVVKETSNGHLEKATEAERETLLVPFQPAAGEMAPRPDWTRGSESLRRDVLPHVQSAAAAPVVRRANHHRQSGMPQPPDFSPNESQAERPIVRVTIGRIEVRAQAAPAAPRKTSARSEPKLTLDAYLKARKEGAR